MENKTAFEGEISVGPWSSTEGEHWSFKAKRGIKQIIITHGQYVNTLRFKDCSDDSNPAEYSSVFGVSVGCYTTVKVDIDFPSEFLTGITVTHVREGIHDIVSSITFHSNLTCYGPFGNCKTKSFCFNSEGVISGFHGVSGKYFIGSIGVYIKPACSIIHAVGMKQHADINVRCPGLLPRSPGPWPSSSNNGSEWDDGVFSNVKCVRVYSRPDISVISSIQFCYEKRDGTAFWSLLHGSVGRGKMVEVEFKGDEEFLIGIEGFYWPLDGMDVIRSLTFYTNKGIYGPMGDELGTYFNSMTSKPGNGKLVGFFGRNCAYLNAIGIHTEYF